MKKITLILVLGVGLSSSFLPKAQADEIQFTTLPQPVQTAVIRETHVSNPSHVTRVVRSENGVYAVTVRADAGEQVVYVNSEGAIVQAPSTSATTTTTVQQRPAEEAVVTYEQVQKDQPRYELIKKEGRKEIYLDRQTGKKVKVEREKD